MACLLFSCTGRRFFSGKPDFHQVLFVSVNDSIEMSMGKFMSKLKYVLRILNENVACHCFLLALYQPSGDVYVLKLIFALLRVIAFLTTLPRSIWCKSKDLGLNGYQAEPEIWRDCIALYKVISLSRNSWLSLRLKYLNELHIPNYLLWRIQMMYIYSLSSTNNGPTTHPHW